MMRIDVTSRPEARVLTAWLAFRAAKMLPDERNEDSNHLHAVATCLFFSCNVENLVYLRLYPLRLETLGPVAP